MDTAPGSTPWIGEGDDDLGTSLGIGDTWRGGENGKEVEEQKVTAWCSRYSGYGGCSESDSEWAEDRDGWSDR